MAIHTIAMDAQLLICPHHRHALSNACERGFWMPLALPAAIAEQVSHLAAIQRTSHRIRAIAPVTEMVLFSREGGITQYLPFVGQQLPLAHPIALSSARGLELDVPLGHPRLLLLPLDPRQTAAAARAGSPSHGPRTTARPGCDHARRSSGRHH